MNSSSNNSGNNNFSSNSSEALIRDIKRRTKKKYSSEEKIRIVLEGIRGEVSIAELCRKEGINPNLYYNWSKDFLEAGKKRLQRDTAREATRTEVGELRKENSQLKALVAEVSLKHNTKKKLEWFGERMGRLMRYSQSEKMEIICLVESSKLSVRSSLEELQVNRSSFYSWYDRYKQSGYEGLKNRSSSPNRFWNKIPQLSKRKVISLVIKCQRNHRMSLPGI